MRRQIITHPEFQSSVGYAFAIGVLIVFALITAYGYGLMTYISSTISLTDGQSAILRHQTKSLLFVLIILGVIGSIGFFFLGLFLSNRYVGPLRRIENWLQSQMLGDVPERLRLRPKDGLRDIAEILNNRVYKLRKKRQFE